jgi:ribosomal-protein-alanine N-acetyltransferase
MTLTTGDEVIETDRLLLRRMTAADLPFYTRIHADPEVARYIAHGNPRTPEETRAFFDSILHSYEATGLGHLAVMLKADGSLLGRCGLSYVEIAAKAGEDGVRDGYFFPARAPDGVDATPAVELGYTFDQVAWGKGYAREAAGGVYQYATRRLDRQGIISMIHADNIRSRGVAAHYGATCLDRVRMFDRIFDCYRWPG